MNGKNDKTFIGVLFLILCLELIFKFQKGVREKLMGLINYDVLEFVWRFNMHAHFSSFFSFGDFKKVTKGSKFLLHLKKGFRKAD